MPSKPPNVILLLAWGVVRVKCPVQEHSMVNSAKASSLLECSKWIEAHWPPNHKFRHKSIVFPAYSCSRATINYFIIIIIIIIIINNFGKSLLQLYHVLKLVQSRVTTCYLTTHENTSFLSRMCWGCKFDFWQQCLQSFLTFTVLLCK